MIFFHADGHGLILTGLSDLEPRWSRCEGHAYALLGMRCYMARREAKGMAAPRGAVPIAACAVFRMRWRLEPLIVREVPNHGDVAFPLYPDAPRLMLGLYRVLGPALPSAPPSR